MRPEFSRPIELAGIPADGRIVDLVADAEECRLLATRFDLAAVDSLECRFALCPLAGGGLSADGLLRARVRQVCVVSNEAFQTPVTEEFVLHFVPPEMLSAEIELEGPDHIPITGRTVDLGEAAAEQLALALDPYPRHPDLPEPPDAEDHAGPSPFAMLRRPS